MCTVQSIKLNNPFHFTAQLTTLIPIQIELQQLLIRHYEATGQSTLAAHHRRIEEILEAGGAMKFPCQTEKNNTMLTDSEFFDALPQRKEALVQEIRKAVIGQDDVVEQLLVALFSSEHCLLIGVPGLAKTLLINTVAQALGLSFGRVQLHP